MIQAPKLRGLAKHRVTIAAGREIGFHDRMDPASSILLEPYRAVYVDIAKNASSSLKAVLADALGLDLASVGGNPHRLQFPRPPRSGPAAERPWPGLFTFAFVRNPWERLVSCYRDKIRGETTDFTGFAESGVAHCLAGSEAFSAGMSFEAFAQAVTFIPDAEADEHFRSQHVHLVNDSGGLAVDYLGRCESLAADFREVAERISLPQKSLPRLQSAATKVDYRQYYTERTRQVVAERYARDIELFGYSFS